MLINNNHAHNEEIVLILLLDSILKVKQLEAWTKK